MNQPAAPFGPAEDLDDFTRRIRAARRRAGFGFDLAATLRFAFGLAGLGSSTGAAAGGATWSAPSAASAGGWLPLIY